LTARDLSRSRSERVAAPWDPPRRRHERHRLSRRCVPMVAEQVTVRRAVPAGEAKAHLRSRANLKRSDATNHPPRGVMRRGFDGVERRSRPPARHRRRARARTRQRTGLIRVTSGSTPVAPHPGASPLPRAGAEGEIREGPSASRGSGSLERRRHQGGSWARGSLGAFRGRVLSGLMFGNGTEGVRSLHTRALRFHEREPWARFGRAERVPRSGSLERRRLTANGPGGS
jgi:hypothetical protein